MWQKLHFSTLYFKFWGFNDKNFKQFQQFAKGEKSLKQSEIQKFKVEETIDIIIYKFAKPVLFG